MELKLNLKEDKKYLEILRILSNIKNPEIAPFNSLRNRELEVLAVLLFFFNEKYKDIPEEKRNILIFSYESRQEISERLGDISIDTVYNIMMDLRKKGIIEKRSINNKVIIPNVTSFSLNFGKK
jgi:DNA-binding transcriptional ArsR family regulator